MKFNKMKKIAAVGILAASVALTGCSSLIQQGLEAANRQNQESDENVSAEGDFDSANTSTDTKLSFSEIEELAATCVYGVDWLTTDGSFAAGTSFIMDSETHGNVIVSAFHYLWPDDASSFSGEELASYVTGGSIYNSYDYEETGATLKNCIIIEDADISPNTSKDVSAFTIENGDDLNSLPLSTHEAKKGDTVYLLANLWDTDDIHENCVYEGSVISDKDGIFTYDLDSKYGTAGASGAPIVNEYGEVVAIHMGSSGSMRIANSVTSFPDLVNEGTVSDITYSSDVLESTDSSDEGDYEDDLPIYTFERDETIETSFFDLKVNSVTVTDTLGSYTAYVGEQFIVVNVTMNSLDSTPIDMYYSDFVLEWDTDYCYPLESGYTDNQLPDEYLVTSDTTGDLVFAIPDNVSEVVFDYLDYYLYDGSDEIYYNAYYDIELPVENWSRSSAR